MFCFVFQSFISIDFKEYVIPPSDAKVIPSSDAKVIPPSDVKVIPPSDVKVIPSSDVKVIPSSDVKVKAWSPQLDIPKNLRWPVLSSDAQHYTFSKNLLKIKGAKHRT